MKINTVVVTFNKIEILKECLVSLLSQKDVRDVDLQFYVVDNKSTDGTQEFLQELEKENTNVHAIFSKENIGGAGGFHLGIQKAMSNNPDYIWVMDDDTIPDSFALYELIGTAEKIHMGGAML